MASVSFFSQPLAFGGCSSKIRFMRVHNNHKPAGLTVSSAASLAFRDLDADDFRHPLDKQVSINLFHFLSSIQTCPEILA